MSTPQPNPVEFDELLASEFDYIAQTALQANEDRARVSSFYLVAVGSLVAAMFGTQLFESDFLNPTVDLMFGGLFVLLTLLGTSTILQLARLRAAWYESALAMNQLKDFMMGENKTLVQAFRWKTSTLPARYKRSSVSYFQALEVALISGLTFAAAAVFLQLALVTRLGWLHWLISFALGCAAFSLQLLIYRQVTR